MKVGFIGTGSMGSLLIDAFIQSGALLPEQIRVSNRSPESRCSWQNVIPV